MVEAMDETKLLKPGDLIYKADFWLAIESGELPKTIAWSLRKEDNPKKVLTQARQSLFGFVNMLKTPAGEKSYKPSRKDIESFSKKFDKHYTEFHYLEKVNEFLSKFPDGTEDEQKFDKLNAYLWKAMFKVTDLNVEETFKQWMVNEKRLLKGLQVDYPILFGLWSPTGGNGKSFLLECLARALSDNNLFVLNQWSDLESTSGSYLKDVFGVLYKDEIGTTKGIKDTIKSLITTSEITVQCKYKEPIKLPKRFQLVCSANKPIGTRVFEDESGYQRRDGTHECWGRLFDVESKDDLIKYFRKMFEYTPIEHRMEGLSTRQFEFDEETIDILEKLASSPMMVDTHAANASKAVKIQPFSKICNDLLGISKENEPQKYYKLEALLEKSGCFERKKYGSVSTRYFKAIPEKLADALENVNLENLRPTSIREYSKPTVKKSYEQMIKEAFEYNGQNNDCDASSETSQATIDRLEKITRRLNIIKSDELSPSDFIEEKPFLSELDKL